MRITNASDYQRILASPCRYTVGKVLVARVAAADCQAHLGLALSRRHLPSAVDRNTIKRLLREHFRLVVQNLYPVDIVFVSYKKIFDISFQKQKLKQDLPSFFSLFIHHE